MKIAVLNETSAGSRNPDIVESLEGRGHEILNVGMKTGGTDPQLSYMHTGFLAGLLLSSGRADYVVGGCGTGQGFLNSVMQYPNVFCGLIMDPLDAWLFTQINGGNCISLALNKGYGWAGDKYLSFIFDRIFSVESGAGYPEHRKEPQRHSRKLLQEVSRKTHHTMAEIVSVVPEEISVPALTYPGVLDVLDIDSLKDHQLKNSLEKIITQKTQ